MRRPWPSNVSNCLWPSAHWLCFGEFPPALKNFLARAIEAHRIVPTLHDRNTIAARFFAAAELDRDRAIGVRFRRKVIE